MRKPLALLIVLSMAASLLAACGGGGTAEPTPASSGGGTSTQVEPTGGGGGPAETPTQALSAEQRVPEDIPIPDTATNLHVDSRGTTVTYSVAMSLEDLILFYQAELTANGWEPTGGSESLFGRLATIVRKKGASRVSVTMNGNPNTDDVFVQVNLAR